MKRIYINIVLTCSFIVCALTACTDVWEDHYQPNPALSGDKTLWELISSKSELTDFAALLEATGYDSLLMMNRSYTVWAPTQMPADFDITQLDNDSMLNVYRKEIVENHIADFTHVAGGVRDKEDKKNYSMIKMLNGKLCDFTGAEKGYYQFANNSLMLYNQIAKNGVLHVLNGYAAFSSNIWEQLAKEKELDSLRTFLYKSFKREFSPALSVPGPIKDGKLTYLDSVFTESCRWFYQIGYLNREDSVYTMYALTNDAWTKMVAMTKEYFMYPPKMVSLPELGSQSSAQVTDSMAREMVVRNLVFSNTVNRKYFQGEKDTLISTNRIIFPGDSARALMDGHLSSLSLSNGDLHIINQVNFKPYTWGYDTIRVEGENLWYQTEEVAVVQDANASSKTIDKEHFTDTYNSLSRGSVGIFTPKEEHDQPVLNFYVDDVLSGYYKVSVVVLPPQIVDTADVSFIKPNMFDARIYFADGTNSGRLAPKGYRENRDDHPSIQEIVRSKADKDTVFVSDVNKIDKIVLANCIKIPYSEYRLKSLTGETRKTRLELTSRIKSAANGSPVKYDNLGKKQDGKWKYDNSYRIDQVIFEPVEAPVGE